MTIQSSTVSANLADSDGGGVRMSNGGTLRVSNSVVSFNQALGLASSFDGFGGGIGLVDSSGAGHSHEIVRSLIAANQALNGAGLFSNVTAPQPTLIDGSTVSDNSASLAGGGAYFFGGGVVLNSTFSGNMGAPGVQASQSPGEPTNVALTNSTLAGNQAASGTGGVAVFDGATVLFRSSVAQNTGQNCDGTDGTIATAGYNVASDASCGLERRRRSAVD